jgi:isochorismate synthase
MTATTDLLPQLAQLRPLLERAQRAAAERGRPVLASFTVALPDGSHSPLALIDQPNAFLWDQPSRGFSIAASGQAARVVADGPRRFEETRLQLQRLLADALIVRDGASASSPIAYAGFAFDPQHPDNVAWFGFPDGAVVVPRLLLTLDGSQRLLTTNALVDVDTDAAGVVSDLIADASRALAPPTPRTDEEPSARLLDPGEDARVYWGESVLGLTRRIAAGDAGKVVLARRVAVESDGPFDVSAVIERLRARYQNTTVFAFRTDNACFLGATPERLVRLHERTVHTDCLAGSFPRGSTAAEDEALGAALQADEKERREHAFVVRSLREALAGLCGDVRLPETPGLRKMANVQHLYTPVEATTDSPRHVLELVEALHPTAATAGLPRERSLALIREHEPFSRGWYAGPIGWIDAEGGGEFAVALRSALLREDVASLYAGCGIVAGSDPGREYAESEIKLEAMRWALTNR